MRIMNPYTVHPEELKPGDVLIRSVTLHVMEGRDGELLYRMYECPFDGPALDGVPQGNRIYADIEALQRQLFPVAGWAGARPDDP